MKPTRIAAALLLALGAMHAQAADLFPLRDVRLGAGPFLDAQTTDLNYLMAMEPDRLLAPFLREAGLPPGSRATATGSRPAWTATWAATTCPRWR